MENKILDNTDFCTIRDCDIYYRIRQQEGFRDDVTKINGHLVPRETSPINIKSWKIGV